MAARREGYRRTIKDAGPSNLRTAKPPKHNDEMLSIAKTNVITASGTAPIYDVIQTMAKEGFRRLPIVDSGTKRLEGIVTASDIVDYLGGGQKFEIIQRKYDGNFFKAINEPVRIIMTQNVISILLTAKLGDAIRIMKDSDIGGLPIVDDRRRVKAIITERDIASLFAGTLNRIKVGQVMSENVVTALSKTTIFEAEKTMTSEGFRRLPIVEGGKVVGIITAMDIIRFFGLGDVFKHLKSGTILQILNTPSLEIASKPVLTVETETDLGEVARTMHGKNIGAMPVVTNGRLVGIITERDFFKIIE